MFLTVRDSKAVNWFSQRADGIFNSAYGHTVLLTMQGSQAVNWFSQRADGIFNSAHGHTVLLTVRGSQAINCFLSGQMAFLTVHTGTLCFFLTVRGSQAVNWFSKRADCIFNSAYGHTLCF